ncbi:L-dopachrome tautomerase-related protein [Pontibacter cellulosilyticus]|uniref:SMP-30/gluconolactonase/LRE family protein n=1 Tax=Pontibacter cellulosilyticus TaxID=1720253 RepID=A0A923N6U0_9BACT|nr:L-dopachrome tautomerase-related protein [Pontibacter cellulosilyticus]MBC5992491.1 SMP-30/gluconolactonase/LRE family protein [Pontibacter cellulosilyticus]
MKHFIILLAGLALALSSCTVSSSETEADLGNEVYGEIAPIDSIDRVFSFKGAQVTGVTISEDGRMFANFPRWREGVTFSVVEVLDNGTFVQYPSPDWNTWTGEPKPNQFTCVQSVIAHKGSLFVLDPSNPMMQGVVGNATLYEFDLASNKLKNKWEFDRSIAPEKSYLNDLRVDDQNQKIYITDSGMGALVILDLATGKARRILEQHPSTKAENITLKIDGKKWLQNGKQPQIHSDGIALNQEEGYLYYHALTGYTLYRIPTTALNNTSLSSEALGKQVENLGKTPAPDGMIFDKRGNLYMADLENNAIVYRTPTGEIKQLIQGEQISWADTFTIYQDNLYFTASRIHEAGPEVNRMVFSIYKVPLTPFVQ